MGPGGGSPNPFVGNESTVRPVVVVVVVVQPDCDCCHSEADIIPGSLTSTRNQTLCVLSQKRGAAVSRNRIAVNAIFFIWKRYRQLWSLNSGNLWERFIFILPKTKLYLSTVWPDLAIWLQKCTNMRQLFCPCVRAWLLEKHTLGLVVFSVPR